MTLAEFHDLLDVHGARLSAWPDDLRAAAEHYLAAEPAARTALDHALRLDRLIMRGTAGTTKPDVAAARVLARLAELPPQRRFALAWPAALLMPDLSPARLRIAALGAFACLGIVIGLFGPDIATGDYSVAASGPEVSIAAMLEPEPLTGVAP